MRLSIRTKLLGTFGIVLALTAFTGAVGLFNLNRTDQLAGTMYEHSALEIRDLAQVRAYLGDVDSQLLRAFVDHSGEGPAKYTAAAEKDMSEIDRLMVAFEAADSSDEEGRALATYHNNWNEYREGVA